MKTETSNEVPQYLYLICVLVGAFVGFLIPETKTVPSANRGIVAAIIAFELNYLNLITTIGLALFAYLLFTRRVRGKEAMAMHGALGFAATRLIVASLGFLSR